MIEEIETHEDSRSANEATVDGWARRSRRFRRARVFESQPRSPPPWLNARASWPGDPAAPRLEASFDLAGAIRSKIAGLLESTPRRLSGWEREALARAPGL